jgi:hypothetical protein
VASSQERTVTSYQYQRITKHPKLEQQRDELLELYRDIRTEMTELYQETSAEQANPEPQRDYHAAYGQLRRDILEYAAYIESLLSVHWPNAKTDIASHLRYLAGDEEDANG